MPDIVEHSYSIQLDHYTMINAFDNPDLSRFSFLNTKRPTLIEIEIYFEKQMNLGCKEG